MRCAFPLAAALAAVFALAACGPNAPPSTATPDAKTEADAALPADCALSVSRTVAFTSPQAQDTIEARTLPAKDCAQTVFVWTLRAADGQVLHAYAAPYGQIAQQPTPGALRAALARWAEPVIGDTSQAPAWTGPATEYPKSFGPDGATPLIQPVYERVRAEKRPRLCLDTSYEAFACFYFEAESGHLGLLFSGSYQEMQRQ